MTQTNTPGPWEAVVATLKHGIPTGAEQFAVCAQGNPLHIVAITGATGAPDEAESIANARLISAAPEMLEALQAIDLSEKHYSEIMDTTYDSADERRRARAKAITKKVIALEKVRAAIAKAKDEA